MLFIFLTRCVEILIDFSVGENGRSILVPSGAYQCLTRFRCAMLACSSTGICPLIVLTKGRRSQPAHPGPARHNQSLTSPNPASECQLQRPKSCLHYNFSLLPHCRSLGLPSSILERASGDILPYKKNNYLISLIPNYYAQAYLRKRIRFSLFFCWLHQRTGDEFERDTPLLCCSEGVLHMDELGEERAP